MAEASETCPRCGEVSTTHPVQPGVVSTGCKCKRQLVKEDINIPVQSSACPHWCDGHCDLECPSTQAATPSPTESGERDPLEVSPDTLAEQWLDAHVVELASALTLMDPAALRPSAIYRDWLRNHTLELGALIRNECRNAAGSYPSRLYVTHGGIGDPVYVDLDEDAATYSQDALNRECATVLAGWRGRWWFGRPDRATPEVKPPNEPSKTTVGLRAALVEALKDPEVARALTDAQRRPLDGEAKVNVWTEPMVQFGNRMVAQTEAVERARTYMNGFMHGVRLMSTVALTNEQMLNIALRDEGYRKAKEIVDVAQVVHPGATPADP